jgi:hypothetical protein
MCGGHLRSSSTSIGATFLGDISLNNLYKPHFVDGRAILLDVRLTRLTQQPVFRGPQQLSSVANFLLDE